MAVGWFVTAYVRAAGDHGVPAREPQIRSLAALIDADGGDWYVTEGLGQWGLAKVNASTVTLTALGALQSTFRLPVDHLDDSLAGLAPNEKNALRSQMLSQGYTVAEYNEAFPNDLGTYTLREVAAFVLKRRLGTRYDVGQDQIVADGPVRPTEPLWFIDTVVGDGP